MALFPTSQGTGSAATPQTDYCGLIGEPPEAGRPPLDRQNLKSRLPQTPDRFPLVAIGHSPSFKTVWIAAFPPSDRAGIPLSLCPKSKSRWQVKPCTATQAEHFTPLAGFPWCFKESGGKQWPRLRFARPQELRPGR